MKKKAFVCRCEDISEVDLLNVIDAGYTDLEELRKVLRIGMGPCQGRTCAPILYDIVSAYTNKPVPDIPLLSVRSPVKPVSEAR